MFCVVAGAATTACTALERRMEIRMEMVVRVTAEIAQAS